MTEVPNIKKVQKRGFACHYASLKEANYAHGVDSKLILTIKICKMFSHLLLSFNRWSIIKTEGEVSFNCVHRHYGLKLICTKELCENSLRFESINPTAEPQLFWHKERGTPITFLEEPYLETEPQSIFLEDRNHRTKPCYQNLLPW